MAGTSVVWDLIARDRASKAFLGAAASAQEMQASVKKSFNEQDAVARRTTSRIKASLKAQEDEYLKAAAAAQKYGKGTAFLNSHKAELDKVATGLAGVGAAAAIGFGAAVKQSMDYNEAMARVGAFSDDARDHMDQLRQLSMKVGTSIGYSATQSAAAMEEMVKAGISATDMINGGLKGALQLAAAGQIDVSEATSVAAAAMTQFGLAGKDIPHLADLLAAGADKALGGVNDLGEALSYSGLQAHQYGVSVEDTVGVLSSFAAAGNLGSTAGTQFAMMLTRLGAPTSAASKKMKEIGLNVYDANGNFVDMTTLAGRLAKTFDKLSPAQRNAALQIIFGQRAMRGANIMIQQGSKGIADWIKKVDDQGFAAQTASRKMDSLKGDLQKLRAEFDNLLISSGEGAQSPFRAAIQQLTEWIDDWNNLSVGAKHAIGDIVGAIAVLGLGGAATIKVLTGIAGMKKALIDLGITGKATGAEMAAGSETAAAGMGKMRKAAGGVAAALIGIQAAGMVANHMIGDYQSSTDEATASLLDLAKSTKGAGTALNDVYNLNQKTIKTGDFWGNGEINNFGDVLDRVFNRSTSQRVNDWIVGVGSSVGLAKGEFDQLKDQTGALDSALSNMAASGSTKQAGAAFAKIAAQARQQHVSMTDLLTLFPQYKEALHRQAAELGVNITSDKEYADWMGGKVPAAVERASRATAENTNATKEQKDAAAAIPGAYQEWKQATDEQAAAEKKLTDQVQKLLNQFSILKKGALDQEQANESWKQSLFALSEQAADSAAASSKVASAQRAVTLAERRLADLRDSGKASRTQILSAEDQLKNARDRLAKATDASSKAAAANSKSLSLNTQVGVDNRQKITAAIQAMNDKVAADFRAKSQTESLSKATADASKSLKQQKKDLIDTAVKAGYNRQEVKKMVDQMVQTPKELRTQVEALGIADLKKQIKDLQKQIDELSGKPHKVQIDYSVLASGKPIKGLAAAVAGRPRVATARATGGFISGPGSGTSDDIPAWLSNGEYVVKAKSVAKLGRHRLDYLNATGDLPRFRYGGLVNHGPMNSGPNGAIGPDATPHIQVSATMPPGTVSGIVSAIAGATASVQAAAVDLLRSALSGGGVRMGGDNVVSWHGGKFTENFANHLKLVYSQQPFQIYQGGFRPTTSYSGSTHNKDAVDVGTAYDKLALLLREQGIAAWHRTPAQGPWMSHTHGVPGPNVGLASPSAAAQYRDYVNGGNGLGGKDDGPRVGVIIGGAGDIPTGSTKQIFRSLMLNAGYPASAWSMVDYIIGHESSWNVHARNPSSGAYGLPQALPGNKMAAYGPDWQNNAATQGSFFFNYVKDRYGGLRQAYNFWRAHHYYADGGPVTGAGSGTSDSIPAMLSNGEFVVNAKAAKVFGPFLKDINAAHFASGGPVGASAFGSSSKFSVSAIVALIRAIQDPTRDLAKFTASVRGATLANKAAQAELRRPKSTLDRATRDYNRAVNQRNNLRLTNARQTNQARTRVANASAQVKAAELALDRMEPKSEKIRKAQSALVSAQKSLDSKRRSAAEAIAKIEDKIKNTKRGTTQYQNLLTEKSLKEKSNARAIAAAEDKVHAARKAAAKAGVNTDKIAAAQRRLTKAENELSRARAHQSKVSRDNALQTAEASAKVAKAEKAKRQATDAYNRASDRARAKAQALKDAQQQLAEQQQAVADSAKQLSDAFAGLYNQPTGTLTDLFKSMTQGATDITTFRKDLDRLRKMGLSESVIDQIVNQAQSGGVQSGIALANQAIGGGSYFINQLNKAAQKLADASDILGYRTASAKGSGYATGTDWATPGIHDVSENKVEVVVGRQARRFMGGEMVKNLSDLTQPAAPVVVAENQPPAEVHFHFDRVTDVHSAAREFEDIMRKDTRWKGGVKIGLRTRGNQ